MARHDPSIRLNCTQDAFGRGSAARLPFALRYPRLRLTPTRVRPPWVLHQHSSGRACGFRRRASSCCGGSWRLLRSTEL